MTHFEVLQKLVQEIPAPAAIIPQEITSAEIILADINEQVSFFWWSLTMNTICQRRGLYYKAFAEHCHHLRPELISGLETQTERFTAIQEVIDLITLDKPTTNSRISGMAVAIEGWCIEGPKALATVFEHYPFQEGTRQWSLADARAIRVDVAEYLRLVTPQNISHAISYARLCDDTVAISPILMSVLIFAFKLDPVWRHRISSEAGYTQIEDMIIKSLVKPLGCTGYQLSYLFNHCGDIVMQALKDNSGA